MAGVAVTKVDLNCSPPFGEGCKGNRTRQSAPQARVEQKQRQKTEEAKQAKLKSVHGCRPDREKDYDDSLLESASKAKAKLNVATFSDR